MGRKKALSYRLHDKHMQKDFLHQTGEWKKTLSQLVQEMLQEHKKLSEVAIKDFSTAVMYQEFLLTTIQFLNRAGETLDEYVLERLEDSGFISDFITSRQKQHGV